MNAVKKILESRKNLGIGGSRLQNLEEDNDDPSDLDDDDLKKDDAGAAVSNFLTKLYEDDNFKMEREEYEQ